MWFGSIVTGKPAEKRCEKMLLQKESKNIAEIRKKDKKNYERRRCSLKKILSFLSPKKRKDSLKVNENANPPAMLGRIV